MFKPKEMRKIRITGAKSNLKPLVNRLYELKLVHLIDFKKDEFFQLGLPFEENKAYSEKLVKLEAIINNLEIKGNGRKISDLETAEEKFLELENEIEEIVKKLEEVKDKEKKLIDEEKISEPLKLLGLDAEYLYGYQKILVFVGTTTKSISDGLKKISKDYELIEADYKNQKLIALFIHPKHKDEIEKLLSNSSFSSISVEKTRGYEEIVNEKRKVKNEISEIEKKLAEIKQKDSQFFLDFEYSLSRENEKAVVPLKFGSTENSFIIEGWVEADEAEKLKAEAGKDLNGKIYVEELESNGNAPVSLDNPRGVRSYEFFLNLYSLPKTIEVDPTALMFVTFPFFFGFMLGDVGYGLATLLLFAFLRKKFGGEMKKLLGALMLASLFTIAFGFVYGEFFGFEFIEHPILNRAHDIMTMLMLSVAIGFVHVNLGLIVGFYNKLMQHGLMDAVLEKGGWFVFESGVILLALDMLKIMPLGMIPGGIVTLLGVGMLFKGEGIRGIIELPSIFSNILSYARLFAVGLASVQLALIVNKFVESLLELGGFAIIGAILIGIVGHSVNIALGILGPFLHSLRLHYVEFFTKFFEGGGKEFIPFGTQHK